MPRSDFDRQLDFGRAGERLVASFLQREGCGVLPAYDYTGSDGKKAPRLMYEHNGLVVPDLDAAKKGARRWVEVKTYSHSPEFRAHGIQIHGIKRRHYDDYLAVEEETGNPVYLSVLEVCSGELLVAKLRPLTVYWCMCKTCKPRGESVRGHNVYFDRSEFRVWTRFPEKEMDAIKATRPEAA
jgi:hypothetical protein